MIPNNIFDFYELEDLDGIANDNTYLTGIKIFCCYIIIRKRNKYMIIGCNLRCNFLDVIGVLDKDMPLRRLTNKLDITQSQVKFEIYDGRYDSFIVTVYNYNIILSLRCRLL